MALSEAAKAIRLDSTTLESAAPNDRKDEIRFSQHAMLHKGGAPAGKAFLQGAGISTLEEVDIRELERKNNGLKAILQSKGFNRGASP